MANPIVQALIPVVGGDREIARARHLADLAVLCSTVDALVEAAGPEDTEDWHAVFDAIYGGGHLRIEQERLFHELHLAMPDYHDPDGTWRQDALAWIEAFRSVAGPLVEEISGWGCEGDLAGVCDELRALEERSTAAGHVLAAMHVARARAAIRVIGAIA